MALIGVGQGQITVLDIASHSFHHIYKEIKIAFILIGKFDV
jgi:hypothetical protein